MILKFIVIIVVLCSIKIIAQENLQTTYYDSGNKKEEFHLEKNIRNGEAKLYYENGKMKEERNYVNGKIEGFVKIYAEDGHLEKTIYIEDGKRNGPTSLFAEDGTYQRDIFYENGKRIPDVDPYEELEKQLIASSKDENKEQLVKAPPVKLKKKVDPNLPPQFEEDEIPENDPAFFLTAEVMPEPVGGMETIQKKVLYPKRAQENKIEGTVKIRVFIDEFGEVTQAEVAEGIGYGCDEAARIAVFYTKFKPALLKGKPVKVQTTIPVEFKLKDKS